MAYIFFVRRVNICKEESADVIYYFPADAVRGAGNLPVPFNPILVLMRFYNKIVSSVIRLYAGNGLHTGHSIVPTIHV